MRLSITVVLIVGVMSTLPACASRRANAASARGAECLHRNDLRCAIREYAAAVRLDPDVSRHHYNLGLALGRAHLFDQAAGEFREALRLDPSNIDASRLLSAANMQIQERVLP